MLKWFCKLIDWIRPFQETKRFSWHAFLSRWKYQSSGKFDESDLKREVIWTFHLKFHLFIYVKNCTKFWYPMSRNFLSVICKCVYMNCYQGTSIFDKFFNKLTFQEIWVIPLSITATAVWPYIFRFWILKRMYNVV